MSKCVLHMMKHDRGAVSGIQSHVNREHEPKTNRDIDPTRTAMNYHLIEPPVSYHKAIKQRIDELPLMRAVRKDAVLMCSFIVSSDRGYFDGLSQEQQRDFFSDAVKFFQDRYGKENVIAATVHMDEATPHMHLCLTPIRNERLSAKAIFTKQELRDLQTQFAASVGENHGLERGEENSKAEHLSELDYKLKMRTQELEAAGKQIAELVSAKEKLEKKAARFDELRKEFGTLGYEQSLFSAKKVSVEKADLERLETTITASIAKTVSLEDELRKTAKTLEEEKQLRKRTQRERDNLRQYKRKYEHVPEDAKRIAERAYQDVHQEMERLRALPPYSPQQHGYYAELVKTVGYIDEMYWVCRSQRTGEEVAVRVDAESGNRIDAGEDKKRFAIHETVRIDTYNGRVQISHMSQRDIEMQKENERLLRKEKERGLSR